MNALKNNEEIPLNNELLDKLIASLNESSSSARNSWIAFVVVIAYLAITLSSTTSRDIFLNSPLSLPIFDVKVSLKSFFVFAPFVVAVLHIGLLIQHWTTARKAEFFERFLRNDIVTRGRNDREHDAIRSRIGQYVYIQMLVGPHRSNSPMSHIILAMCWLSLFALPILLLLGLQLRFLSYHDVSIVWWQRLILAADLSALFVISPIMSLSAGGRLIPSKDSFLRKISAFSAIAIVAFSTLIATIPNEPQDQILGSLPVPLAIPREDGEKVFLPTALLFENSVFWNWWQSEQVEEDGLDADNGYFSRNIEISGEFLSGSSSSQTESKFIDLRNRDFRFAQISFSTIDFADFAGADLRRARIHNTSFKNVRLSAAKLQNVSITHSSLPGAELSGADAWKSDFQGTDLRGSTIIGTNFSFAHLAGTNFDGAYGAAPEAIGNWSANFFFADPNSASFRGAYLVGADFTGVDFQQANFKAANLSQANMAGADMRWVQLDQANVSDMSVWRADPPENLEKYSLEGSIVFNDGCDPDMRSWLLESIKQNGLESFADSEAALERMNCAQAAGARELRWKKVSKMNQTHADDELPNDCYIESLETLPKKRRAQSLFELSCRDPHTASAISRAFTAQGTLSNDYVGLMLSHRLMKADAKQCPGLTGITPLQFSRFEQIADGAILKIEAAKTICTPMRGVNNH